MDERTTAAPGSARAMADRILAHGVPVDVHPDARGMARAQAVADELMGVEHAERGSGDFAGSRLEALAIEIRHLTVEADALDAEAGALAKVCESMEQRHRDLSSRIGRLRRELGDCAAGRPISNSYER